jgi:hypothetical protein
MGVRERDAVECYVTFLLWDILHGLIARICYTVQGRMVGEGKPYWIQAKRSDVFISILQYGASCRQEIPARAGADANPQRRDSAKCRGGQAPRNVGRFALRATF